MFLQDFMEIVHQMCINNYRIHICCIHVLYIIL